MLALITAPGWHRMLVPRHGILAPGRKGGGGWAEWVGCRGKKSVLSVRSPEFKSLPPTCCAT